MRYKPSSSSAQLAAAEGEKRVTGACGMEHGSDRRWAINDGRHPPVAMATFSLSPSVQPMPSPPQPLSLSYLTNTPRPCAHPTCTIIALSDLAAPAFVSLPILTPDRRRAQQRQPTNAQAPRPGHPRSGRRDRRCRSAGPRRSSLFWSSSTNMCFLSNQNPIPYISSQQMLHWALGHPTSVLHLHQA
ncbi:hypothetical protein GY45DRAFT_1158545 [Cubamyces sp. BRFM 1775]|nr:hypothetical protein GY45DRAFT_1158545 [Cubamyces sp. BRFM 1775]